MSRYTITIEGEDAELKVVVGLVAILEGCKGMATSAIVASDSLAIHGGELHLSDLIIKVEKEGEQ